MFTYQANDLNSAIQIAVQGVAAGGEVAKASGITGFWMSLPIFCVVAVCVVTRILIDLVVMQHRHWPGAQHPANQLDAASGARQVLVAVWNHYSRVWA